jgi:Fe-S-cluster containining protein
MSAASSTSTIVGKPRDGTRPAMVAWLRHTAGVTSRRSMTDDAVPAGAFAPWRSSVLAALAAGADVDVPCGGCTACCRASYFIHIEPDEVDTLRRIPTELQFAAPGLPPGHVVLGYDERGHCPMLVDDRCSIYEHRPRTCRQYDCRVFAATGVDAADDGKHEVAARASRWRFDHPTAADQREHDAARAAIVFIRSHREVVPPGDEPRTAADLAVLGLRAAEAFLGDGDPDADFVAGALAR